MCLSTTPRVSPIVGVLLVGFVLHKPHLRAESGVCSRHLQREAGEGHLLTQAPESSD